VSRKWKPLPTHLPGWTRYHGPVAKPPSRRAGNRKKRAFKHALKRRLRRLKTSFQIKACHKKAATRYLHLPKLMASATFVRANNQKHWKCAHVSLPSLAWFARATTQAIHAWLVHQRHPFYWSISPISPIPTARISTGTRPASGYPGTDTPANGSNHGASSDSNTGSQNHKPATSGTLLVEESGTLAQTGVTTSLLENTTPHPTAV
jgi:hypothetical protein